MRCLYHLASPIVVHNQSGHLTLYQVGLHVSLSLFVPSSLKDRPGLPWGWVERMKPFVGGRCPWLQTASRGAVTQLFGTSYHLPVSRDLRARTSSDHTAPCQCSKETRVGTQEGAIWSKILSTMSLKSTVQICWADIWHVKLTHRFTIILIDAVLCHYISRNVAQKWNLHPGNAPKLLV